MPDSAGLYALIFNWAMLYQNQPRYYAVAQYFFIFGKLPFSILHYLVVSQRGGLLKWVGSTGTLYTKHCVIESWHKQSSSKKLALPQEKTCFIL